MKTLKQLVGLLLLLLFFCNASWAQVRDGKMKVYYIPPKTEFGKFWQGVIQSGGFYERMANLYNREVYWTRDVIIVIGETGVENCWYSAGDHRVTISYNMYQFVLDFFSKIEPPEKAIKDSFLAMDFIFFHEMGHCVIGELDLPTTGRQEDAADDFAITSLCESGEYGRDVAFAAGQLFQAMASKGGLKNLQFWDEHGLDLQRMYEIFGTFYGSNPNRYLFVEEMVPRERLARYKREYAKKARSWDRILNPHLRKPRDIN